MFSTITGQQFLLLSAAFIAVYYVIIGFTFRKQIGQPLRDKEAVRPAFSTLPPNPFELVGKPAIHAPEAIEIPIEKEEDPSSIERIDDEEKILGKEAEKVVEQIQETLHHIASHPPNPEEVFTKINAIVRNYQIFQNTEYFEPINRFIALTVSRDCQLNWTEPELLALWS